MTTDTPTHQEQPRREARTGVVALLFASVGLKEVGSAAVISGALGAVIALAIASRNDLGVMFPERHTEVEETSPGERCASGPRWDGREV